MFVEGLSGWQALVPMLGFAPWIIPAIIAAGGALFGNKNKNQQGQTPIQPGTPLYDYLTTGMVPGGGGGGGGSSTSTTRQNMTETRNLSTMPQIAPEYQALQQLMRGIMEQRLRFPGKEMAGIEALGIQNVNQGFQGARQALENRLSSSGQYGSAGPTAAAFGGLEGQRVQGINQFRLGLPALARQFQDQDINLAAMLNQVFGLGQTQKGTIKTQGTSTTTGNTSGGGGGGPRFDPSGPLQFLQMQQQAANQPNFFERMLPLLMNLLGSGKLGGGSSGGKTASIGGNAGG